MKGYIFIASLFLLGCIADGIENGASLLTLLWCVPVCFAMVKASRV